MSSVPAQSSTDAETDTGPCFHCGLPVPPGSDYRVEIDGASRPMCCPGCQAVAESIVAAGLTDFYRHRTAPARSARDLVPDALREMELYDRPALQQTFVRSDDANMREASLILEGITCAACVWLNERHVSRLPGVESFQVNYATHRARVRWDDSRIHLSDILRAIASIGYIAHPFDPGRQEQVFKRERSLALRRIAVAGLGMMQVMMIAVGLYAGDAQGMDAELRNFLRWVSLLITLPVVFYAAVPFFRGAWRDLKRGRPGMDVPVALAIGLAFAASAWHTLRGVGEIYFDSVTMFTFFLLTGRYLEMSARHRAGEAAEALVRLLPATARRLQGDAETVVAVAELVPGDRVRIRPGETVPADGRIVEGRSSVDESLLSGESVPVARGPGDRLVGGSVNAESPLVMEVEQVGEDTVLSAIVRLLDRAQAEKPAVARLADRVAGWFVVALLLLAAGVAWYWWQVDPDRAFAITLSVLVVTCPCALSLATPVALTAATGALTRLGVLTTRSHALETLARVSHMVFDKTGTLTEGRLRLAGVVRLGTQTRDRALAIAAALETASEHPLARALQAAAPDAALSAADLVAVPGEGIEGEVQGRRYRIGTRDFALGLGGRERPLPTQDTEGIGSRVWLADERELLAVFLFQDRLRSGARATVQALRDMGIEVSLLSGDHPAAVRAVAEALGIEDARGGLKPDQKLAHLKALQAQGAVVAMVGDGVNDAPTLAAAQVSIAMGSGTQLAAAAADMVLLSERLPHLAAAVRQARRTLAIIRQNLAWALGYNGLAVPLAVAGWVAPWMAAIGMSASSLAVALNSLRLRRAPEPLQAED
ncbi:heavy metal translocating P-type ATPase [Thiohalobacter sp.]|uniref:heavy metal translocating P-type ATPase n=1 Tax=Thiohalobacter sp. TaxID=2025948 RepID=UPI00261E5F8D|nr:heavy metal translocating P-type ATPase [Thiohalobacter sp.]